MLTRILVLAIAVSANYLSVSADAVTLTDKQGRGLICEIVSKSESLVIVSDPQGRELNINLSLLDGKSLQLVNDWIHPSKALFQIFYRQSIIIKKYKLSIVEFAIKNFNFMNFIIIKIFNNRITKEIPPN